MKCIRVAIGVATISAVLAAAGSAQDAAKPRAAGPRKTPRKAPAAAPAAAPVPRPPDPPPAVGVRLKTAQTQQAQVSSSATYIQGTRQRVEFPGVVVLDQCDLGQSVLLNMTARKYRLQPYPEAASKAPDPADAPASELPAMGIMGMAGMTTPHAADKPRGGVVTLTTTLADTLERQTILGFEARRIKSTITKQASGTVCDKTSLRVDVDAWYIDLPTQAGCMRPQAPPPAAADPAACSDKIETRVAGDVKLGFPVKSVTTSTTGEGDKTEVSVSSQEVTEIEVAHIDPGVFEIPAGFTEAVSGAEILPALASGGSLADAFFGSTADGSSLAAPKKPGVTRIGVLEPINKTPRSLSGPALRQELVTYFNRAHYEAIPLRGTSPAEIDAEAASLACDYVLLSEVTEAKTSKPGKIGGVMRVTGSAPKDANEVKLDYKLFAAGASAAPRLAGNVKASSGGFGVGSALRLAAFAGRMYLTMGMMGGMGGMGMMNSMAGLSGAGGAGVTGGYFDPRASAIHSMMSGLGGGGDATGMSDPSESGMREAMSDALENEAKAAIEQLGKKK